MTSQLMTLSSDFKEKNGLHCLARARTSMKNTKETVYHCYNSCEMFSQFDVSFTYYIPFIRFLPFSLQELKISLVMTWPRHCCQPSFHKSCETAIYKGGGMCNSIIFRISSRKPICLIYFVMIRRIRDLTSDEMRVDFIPRFNVASN